MEFGYTLLCEQTPPKQLVADLVEAEEAGFAYSVISDHYFPGWRTRATPPTPGRCSAPSPRPPTASR